MFDQFEMRGVLVGLTEQSLPRPEQERKDEQVVPIDEPGVGQASPQGGAAVYRDRPTIGVPELGNVVDTAQNGCRPP